MGRAAGGVVWGLLALVAACGPRTVDRVDIDHRVWLDVQTPHFIITTDVDEREARRLAHQLETSWYTLTAFYNWMTPGRRAPAQRFRVYYLAREDDFEHLVGAGVAAGLVTQAGDYSGERIAVSHHGSLLHRDVAVHELVHMFNNHYVPGAPTWLNEGLANYLETMRVRGTQVTFGRPSPADWWKFGRSTWVGLDEIREMSPDEFYRAGGSRHRNYFAAWKLVHMLNSTASGNHDRFRRYLGAMAGGADRVQAWNAAFGDRHSQLVRSFERYQLGRTIELWTADLPLPEIPQATVRRMRADEAHAVWFTLMLTRRQRALAASLRRQLAAADDAGTNWPRRHFWIGVIAARDEALAATLGDPVGHLRKHLAASPGDATAWRALVSLRMNRALPAGHLGTEAPPPGLAELEADVVELVKRSSTPPELNLIAWYFAIRDKPRTGHSFVLRALDAEPGCSSCVDTLALVEFRLGHPARAVELQTRAIHMMGEHVSDSARERLAVYRRAAGMP